MSKILWCSWSDYSNLTFHFAKSLQSIGIDSEALSLIPHSYGYKDQARVVTREEMKAEMEKADCIIIGHTAPVIFDMCKFMGKRLFVIHTGTLYRQNPQHYNLKYNPFVEATLTDSPEFMSLGAKNIHYIAAAIDTDAIKYSPTTNIDPVFAHYPSQGGFKGTEKIKQMMAKFPNAKFICDEHIVPHDENLRRMAACDVYLELFSPTQEGNEYGSAGVTAWEAAALGKIVVTNTLYKEVYEKVYGDMALIIANTEDEFTSAVEAIIESSPTERAIGHLEARQWIEDKHSYKSTGNYLKQFFK